MLFNCPSQQQVPLLWELWKEAFGDEDEYLEIFYSKAFAPERSICAISDDGRAVAALYWFDCTLRGEKIAYIFGVAVSESCRGQGYCRRMMEAACQHLAADGYHGAVLVPARAGLYPMYEKLGFSKCGGVTEKEFLSAAQPETIRLIDEREYTRLRRKYLPADSVVQEGENIAFLAARAHLYAGQDFVFAFVPGMGEFVVEFLGNLQKAGGIVRALGREKLLFRTYGKEKPFAVYRPFDKGLLPPEYFGLPFDF